MGSILTALQYGKPILVMPRLGKLQETRNDHQLATAIRFKSVANIAVAMNENELQSMLNDAKSIEPGDVTGEYASDELVVAIIEFIHGAYV